ncbi:MAG: winged helix-turn-helix domain-containing protein [Rubrivivax sp.]|nr:winged helix-turn-helix domain-containing protein [Rubrivivax sp.]
MSTLAAPAALHFGRFELQPHERRLLADGQPVPLGGRAFDLLLALVERAGRLVDKATLMDLVWPGLVVQENNLAAQMSALRKAVGEDVIATIPGRGYRFVARLQSPAVASKTSAAVDGTPAAAQASAVPGAAGAPRLRTNLPAELPRLLGREHELAELLQLIDHHRVVTVAGAGGIGKSLLTQHALAARRDSYPHGVCWVELAAVTEAAALPGAVAAALGVHGGHGGSLEALAAAVSTLTLLLALDNAEHLLTDVAALTRVLRDAAPGLRQVLTSQAPLHAAGEQVLRIGPLAVPASTERRGVRDGAAAAATTADALRYGAVALLAERARQVDRGFRIGDDDAAAAIDICRALDGVPLAIELAAARAPLLGLPRLAASMHERFAVLTRGHDRHAPGRQRTLRATLDWSHALLQPAEQQAFRRLAVVAGSAALDLVLDLLADAPTSAATFATASAAATADAADPDCRPGQGRLRASHETSDRLAALDALDTLVDRSLVAVLRGGEGSTAGECADGTEDGEPRYRLLETPRAFALEALRRSGELPAQQRRHAQAMATRLDAAYEAFFGGRMSVDDWLRRLEPDLDNAREALHCARDTDDAVLELRIAGPMLRMLPASLHEERMALADTCEARLTAAMPLALQYRTWLELSCALADSQKARGREAAERALSLARQLDAGGAQRDRAAPRERFDLYHALARAASAAAQAGDLAASGRLLAEMAPLEDAAWPAQRRLWGAEAAQWHARMSGDLAGALRFGRQLLALDRERGSRAWISTGNLIDAELAAGRAADAARLGHQLVALLEGTRHEYTLAFARINLLAALLACGDAAAARPVAIAAWAKAAAFDLQHAAAAYLALLCALEDRPRAAAQLAAYSEATYAARDEAREANETVATQRALALAAAKLGDEAMVARLQAQGVQLRAADVQALAFGGHDTG